MKVALVIRSCIVELIFRNGHFRVTSSTEQYWEERSLEEIGRVVILDPVCLANLIKTFPLFPPPPLTAKPTHAAARTSQATSLIIPPWRGQQPLSIQLPSYKALLSTKIILV